MPDRLRLAALALPTLLGGLASATGCAARFDASDPRWQRTLEAYALPQGGHGGEDAHANAAARLRDEADALTPRIEEALALRARTIAAAQRLAAEHAAGRPLTGRDLDELTCGTLEHVALRESLLATAESHEPWIDAPPEALAPLGLTPELQLEGVMLSLGAALTLCDNFLLAVALFQDDARLRAIVDRGDPGYAKARGELAATTRTWRSSAQRERLRRALRFHEEARVAQAAAIAADPQMAYFDALIEASPFRLRLADVDPLRDTGESLRFAGEQSADALAGLGAGSMGLVSMGFGNTVGLVETRAGRLAHRPETKDAIVCRLRAGDVLLEKTPFRLTDRLIPGHFGHVAIWLGTESELRALGIWDDPVVARRHDEIRAGRLVVEALRCGVEMNTLDHFLNVDDLCVLRDPTLRADPRRLGEHLVRALRQVGKPYDFNFDVETSDCIVCSELAYVVYVDLPWPTQQLLGRATISPDHVAQQAIAGRMDVVALYHDGAEITSARVDWLRRRLLEPASGK